MQELYFYKPIYIDKYSYLTQYSFRNFLAFLLKVRFVMMELTESIERFLVSYQSIIAAFLVVTYLSNLLLQQALRAYQNGDFTLTQMFRKGYRQCLPFIWHLGMWFDLGLLFLCGLIVWRYGIQWSLPLFMIAWIPTRLLSLFGQKKFKDKAEADHIPEAHTQDDTIAWLHMEFANLALPILIAFFFGTRHVPEKYLYAVAIYLVLLLFFAHHIVPAYASQKSGKNWYPRNPFGWYFFVSMTLLIAILSFAIWFNLHRP